MRITPTSCHVPHERSTSPEITSWFVFAAFLLSISSGFKPADAQSPIASAVFLGTGTTLKGDWKSGNEDASFARAGSGSQSPNYAQVTLSSGVTTTYTHNPLGLLSDVSTRNSQGTLLSSFGGDSGIHYDALGNRLSTTVNIPGATGASGTTTETYDTHDQLTQETSTRGSGYSQGAGYDAAGNPTSLAGTSSTFNADNQNTAFTFDGNGNPTSYKGVSLQYDAEDRLSAYGSSMTAGYTSEGLRAWKQSGGVTTYFLYDGGSPVCELDNSGVVKAVNSFGATGLISRDTGASSVQYTFDAQGNVAQGVDPTGNVLFTGMFDSWGNNR